MTNLLVMDIILAEQAKVMILYKLKILLSPAYYVTASVAQWLERSPLKCEVVGSIPDCVIPKTV